MLRDQVSPLSPPKRYHRADDLIVVTTYFNPSGYKTKLANYHAFRDLVLRSGLKLLTVECAFRNDPFELIGLEEGRQVRCRDVMWQKERLLSEAVRTLPAKWTKIAWVDCDVLFVNPSWAVQTAKLLTRHVVVQPYAHIIRLPRGHNDYRGEGRSCKSFASIYNDPLVLTREGWDAHGHTGFAWAARRGFFQDCGLYDACILGSGDHCIAHALAGEPGCSCIVKQLIGTPARYAHYCAWAVRAYDACRGEVGCVPGTLLHLWHGDDKNRKYVERQDKLNRLDFDPAADIRVDAAGCWEWCSNKPALRQWAIDYFNCRKEDG